MSIALATLIALPILTPSARAATPALGTFNPITISFGSVPSLKITPPESNSTGTWTFTSSNTSVVIVKGDQLIPVNVGSATLTANQQAIDGFSAASKSTSVTITLGTPLIGKWEDKMVSFTGVKGTFTLSPPPTNSPGNWTFSSANQNVATIKDRTVTYLSLGITVITAQQSSAPNFSASSPVTMVLRVVGPSPTIGNWPSLNKVFTDPPFTLTQPQSNSTGEWTYTFSKPQTILTQNGSTFTIVGVGQATIVASQAPSAIYGPGQVTMKVMIAKGVPTVGIFDSITVRATDVPLVVTPPTSTSDGSWSYTSSDKSTLVVKGNTIQGLKPGTATLTAVQNQSTNFVNSSPVTTTVTITNPPVPPTIPEIPNIALMLRGPSFQFVAPKNESLGSWTLSSSNAAIVTVESSTISAASVGQVIITATQAPDGNYASISKKFNVTVIPKFSYSVKVTGRTAAIKSANPKVVVKIDAKDGKIGKNLLTKGKHSISLYLDSNLLFTQSYQVS